MDLAVASDDVNSKTVALNAPAETPAMDSKSVVVVPAASIKTYASWFSHLRPWFCCLQRR